MWYQNLREAKEERGGANEEESGCWHWDIPGWSQGSALWNYSMGEWRWGWNPPSTMTAATGHHFLRRLSNCCGVSFRTSFNVYARLMRVPMLRKTKCKSCKWKSFVHHMEKRGKKNFWLGTSRREQGLWTAPQSWHLCMWDKRFKD